MTDEDMPRDPFVKAEREPDPDRPPAWALWLLLALGLAVGWAALGGLLWLGALAWQGALDAVRALWP